MAEKCGQEGRTHVFGHLVFYLSFLSITPFLGNEIFGECWWNPNAVFFYVSGAIGYIVLAHYIRFQLQWSNKKIFTVCMPLIAILYIIEFFSGNYYSTRTTEPAVMEQDWQNLTGFAVLMSFAMFLLLSTIKNGGKFYYHVVLKISNASYGMYLMHMLILPHWFGVFNPLLPPYFTIPATAFATYLSAFGITFAISKLPFGKYIVG